MAISIPSGFIEICDYSIGKVEDKSSKSGKALKAAFKLGPSPSIKTNGSIEVGTEAPGQEQEDNQTTTQQTTTQQNNSNSQQSSNSSSQGDNSNSSNNSNNSSDSNNSHESYNYSMLEAYLRSRIKFEADNDSTGSNSQASNSTDTPASNNSSNTTNQSTAQSSNNTTNQSNTQPSDNTSNQENNEEPKFEAGPNLYVKVLLKYEGCTIWHLILEKRVNVDNVTNAIKSGSFKSAYEIAHKDLDVDGIVVMSAKTYINSKAPLGCPFLGRCNYAFDSASDKDDDTTNAVCLAVAPFDGRTNKPSQETVYKVTYSIEEDISNGEIDKLKNGKPANDDKESRGSDENQDAISKWIGRKFKNVGDKTMYGNFLKIREFIDKQVTDKKLEVDSDETETPISYSKVAAVKKSLIIY